jgi:hypothetical protein
MAACVIANLNWGEELGVLYRDRKELRGIPLGF